MKLLINIHLALIFLLLSCSSVGALGQSSNIAQASFTDNASFGNYWELIITEEGELISKSGKYLVYPPEEKNSITNIGKSKVNSICNTVDELGYFSLPEGIGAKEVPIDGPVFFIKLSCKSETNKVWLYPGFRRSELNESEINEIAIFNKVWNILWESSNIQQPKSPYE